MIGLFGDDRCGLNACRSSPDEHDALAREVNAVMGPCAGVNPLTLEAIESFEFWDIRGRKTADSANEELRRDPLAAVGRDLPAVAGLAEESFSDAGTELDIAPEIEAIRNVLDVTQNLRLHRVLDGPLPFLFELFGERI